jgi:hypothetical protein
MSDNHDPEVLSVRVLHAEVEGALRKYEALKALGTSDRKNLLEAVAYSTHRYVETVSENRLATK